MDKDKKDDCVYWDPSKTLPKWLEFLLFPWKTIMGKKRPPDEPPEPPDLLK